MRPRALAALVIATSLGVATCVLQRDDTRTPHAAYVRVLERSGLIDSESARLWLAEATRVLEAPSPVPLQFTRSSLVDRLQPTALAYHVTLRRGQRLDIDARLDGEMPGEIFVDVFDPGEPQRAPESGALRALHVEADEDESVVVRVQPELFRGGRLHVAGRVGPSLRFPVAGADASDLRSGFGDERDAGRRQHEGVDIFAERGTLVLSATDGIVTRVTETDIGGRIVWVWDPERSLALYYAHLDEQHVRSGTRLDAGDVLGTVGNTGNARTTTPHLHFGIYDAGSGAIDPDAFIRPIARGPSSRAATLSRRR